MERERRRRHEHVGVTEDVSGGGSIEGADGVADEVNDWWWGVHERREDGLRGGEGRVHSLDVVNAGAAAVRRSAAVAAAEEFLGVAGNLSGGFLEDVVPRDASPVSFPILVQPHQEQPTSIKIISIHKIKSKRIQRSLNLFTDAPLQSRACLCGAASLSW